MFNFVDALQTSTDHRDGLVAKNDVGVVGVHSINSGCVGLVRREALSEAEGLESIDDASESTPGLRDPELDLASSHAANSADQVTTADRNGSGDGDQTNYEAWVDGSIDGERCTNGRGDRQEEKRAQSSHHDPEEYVVWAGGFWRIHPSEKSAGAAVAGMVLCWRECHLCSFLDLDFRHRSLSLLGWKDFVSYNSRLMRRVQSSSCASMVYSSGQR